MPIPILSRSSNYYSVKEAPPPPVLEEGWREKEMLREEEEERRLREELLMDKRAKVLNKLLEKRLEQLGEEVKYFSSTPHFFLRFRHSLQYVFILHQPPMFIITSNSLDALCYI